MVIYTGLKNLPVHRAMGEISQLIWETCKTYLVTQGKFLLLLWVFIAAIILLYFGVLLKYEAIRVVVILFFSLVGSPAVTEWRGLAFASTPSPTPARRLPACAARHFRSIRFPSERA